MSELNVYHHELRHNEYAEFYLKSEANKVIAELKADYKEASHNKYKRCLLMTELCEERSARYDELQERTGFSWRREIDFYFRWSQHWLELAEKFKEAK